MGIYNSVKYKKPCSKCKFSLTDWQTKDSIVILRSKSGQTYFLDPGFHSVNIKDIEDGTIYSMCPKCRHFEELKIKKGKPLTKQEE